MTTIPTSVDWIGNCLPIRDQGNRPTCLAFALSTVHEVVRGRDEYLSVESLFAQSKLRDGLAPFQGTTVQAALAALNAAGQLAESAWPYGEPAPIEENAEPLRALGQRRPASEIVDRTRESLAGGELVVLVVNLTSSWFRVDSDGRIPEPSSEDQIEGAHAVVAVGYDDSADELRIRNSWGPAWGDGGYGHLPYAYVDRYGSDALTVTAT